MLSKTRYNKAAIIFNKYKYSIKENTDEFTSSYEGHKYIYSDTGISKNNPLLIIQKKELDVIKQYLKIYKSGTIKFEKRLITIKSADNTHNQVSYIGLRDELSLSKDISINIETFMFINDIATFIGAQLLSMNLMKVNNYRVIQYNLKNNKKNYLLLNNRKQNDK